MNRTDIRYRTYRKILEEELLPAMGCTEPIALAYAAAKAREVLGCLPERVEIGASGSIIKNVKSVIVPNTGKRKGMEAAAAVGIVAGAADRELEVISAVTDAERCELNRYLDDVVITVKHIDTGHVFDLVVTTYADGHSASVQITDYHTNIVRIEKDGAVLFEKEPEAGETADREDRADRSLLNMEDIWDFAMTVDPADVSELLDRQIRFNTEIAEEGLSGNYGANIGRIRLETYGTDIKNRAAAKAAAGSDARMGGCELPVIINSGSGNQGITCSVPVVEYAEEIGADRESLYRALVLSNLVSIHEKTGIGTLSAYCGAVSAAAGAGAGISFLLGGGYEAATHTIVNCLAIVSGIVCDGAKPSCAAKIASSIDAAILGYYMYVNGQEFKGGDGIVMKGIEATIRSIGRLGRDGMKQTNEEIIRLMIGEQTV